jgi:hypothetical protein
LEKRKVTRYQIWGVRRVWKNIHAIFGQKFLYRQNVEQECCGGDPMPKCFGVIHMRFPT